MIALPPASVWMVRVPINCWPSPKPESSQSVFEKNCSVKVVLGVPLKVPCMIVLERKTVAEIN